MRDGLANLNLLGWCLRVSQVQPLSLVSQKLRGLGLHAALAFAQVDVAQHFGRRIVEIFSIRLDIFRSIFFSPEAIHVFTIQYGRILGATRLIRGSGLALCGFRHTPEVRKR